MMTSHGQKCGKSGQEWVDSLMMNIILIVRDFILALMNQAIQYGLHHSENIVIGTRGMGRFMPDGSVGELGAGAFRSEDYATSIDTTRVEPGELKRVQHGIERTDYRWE